MVKKSETEELRAAAAARGFKLVKSRRRKPGGDFGRYGLVEAKSGRECFGFGDDGLTGSAEAVRDYLRGGEVASWKRSLLGVVDGGKGRSDSTGSKTKEATATPSPSAKPRKGAKPKPDSPPAFAGGAGGGPASSPQPSPPPPAPAPRPEKLSYRPAKPADAAAIAKLIGANPDAVAQGLAAAKKAVTVPILAERDGIVGVLAWAFVPILAGAARARITLLHVDPEARREGIGRRLIDEAEAAAKKAGADRLELLLDLELDAPTAFLRKIGFQRAANGFGKDLA